MFAGPQQLLERLQAALDGAALRVCGKLCRGAPRDEATLERISKEIGERFLPSLTDEELDSLEAAVRALVPGDDTLIRARGSRDELDSFEKSEPVAEW